MKNKIVLVGERKRKEDPNHPVYHKYLDFRAIVPAAIIAFVFSAVSVFYVLDAVLMPIVAAGVSGMIGLPILIADPTLFMVSKITFFTMDFFVVFFAIYVILLIVCHDQDKKLYMEYKKKRLV
jgi:hypothetical protein